MVLEHVVFGSRWRSRLEPVAALGMHKVELAAHGFEMVCMPPVGQLRAAIRASAAEHLADLFALRFREAAHAGLDPAAAMIASYRRSL
ncbi:hypothetical protein WK61_00265 [Burkholderia ubonensis]|nr:hypothetical protein WK61_00265 [Burkholderia ubonensis]